MSIQEHPGDSHEAPRRHLGDTQEARKRHPGAQRQLGGNMCFHMRVVFSKSDATDHVRVDRSPTITVYRACAQDFAATGAENWQNTDT